MDPDLFADLVQKGGNVAMLAIAIVAYATFQAARKVQTLLEKINDNLLKLQKINQREVQQLTAVMREVNRGVSVLNVDTKTLLALGRRP